MNKILKYTLISSLSLILIVCLYFFVSIINKGLSVNFLKPYLNSKLSDKFENYLLDYKEGLLIYSANTGLQFNINNFVVILDGKDNEIAINKLELPISCIFRLFYGYFFKYFFFMFNLCILLNFFFILFLYLLNRNYHLLF